MCRLAIAIGLGLLFLAPAAGEAGGDPHKPAFGAPMPAGRVADELRAAAAADDDDAIRALAGSTWPDPFEVAARMLFPPTAGGQPTETDKAALRRFAKAASPGTGVRAFIEHWLAADAGDFARERELWRVTARMTMRDRASKHASALEAWDAAVPVLEATPHSHQGPTVRRLRARALRALGRTREAVEVLEDLVERLQQRSWPAYEATAQLALAEAQRALGRSEEDVLAAITRAEALLIRTRQWRLLINALGIKSSCEKRLGRLTTAEATLQRALAVATRSGHPADRIDSKLRIADLADAMDRPQTAATLRLQAFEEGKALKGLDSAAWAAIGLARAEMAAARTAAAMAYGDWLEDHADRVENLGLRGDVAMLLGDLAAWRGRSAAARAHFLRALSDHRGGGSPALVFSDLGRILSLRIEHRETLTTEDEALLAELRQVAEKAAIASDTISVLANWSQYELGLGHPEEAVRIARRAMEHRRAHPQAHRGHFAPLQLARVEIARRRWDAAVVQLEPLLESLSKQDPQRSVMLDLLGRCRVAEGRWRAAVELFREAVDLHRLRRAGLAARESLSQRAREHILATRGVRAAAGWSAAGGGAAAIEAAWWFREMANGRLLAAGVARQGSTGHEDDALRPALAQALTQVEDAHARVVLAAVEGDQTRQREARGSLDEAHRTLFKLESRATRSAGGQAAPSAPEPLEMLSATLPADTAILSYTVGPEYVYGLVVTADASRVLRLGDTAEIRTLATRWKRLASTPAGPDAKLAARLYDTLVRPFDDLVVARENWIVLPDGVLCGAPLDAWIRTTESGAARVIAAHTVTYGQGQGVLDALRARHVRRGPGRGILALGNPVYPVSSTVGRDDWQSIAARGGGGLKVRALPSSGREAREAAALYPELQRVLLLEAKATRADWLAAVVEREAPLDCVHLACHGLVDDRAPSLSGLVFAGGEMLTAERLRSTPVAADLVVLSSCQSGGETVAAGEGLLGLTRAFFRAGATRVLCTSWQVADASTAALMGRFHRARRSEDLSDAAALRRARLALLEAPATAHPYYWAGFQLWGPRGE